MILTNVIAQTAAYPESELLTQQGLNLSPLLPTYLVILLSLSAHNISMSYKCIVINISSNCVASF